MAASKCVTVFNQIQAGLRPLLKAQGFRARGRTFNRITSDGLTQVINLQMGRFDPPGTEYFPGLRELLYGKFTVNVGVYVPEVAKYHMCGEACDFVFDPECCLRARLGHLGPEKRDLWWTVTADDRLIAELQSRFKRHALPYLKRFETRDDILRRLKASRYELPSLTPPRIICAIILSRRGDKADAARLLSAQAKETHNPGHPAYVRSLARRLRVGPLSK
jgi:hypothetical protein